MATKVHHGHHVPPTGWNFNPPWEKFPCSNFEIILPGNQTKIAKGNYNSFPKPNKFTAVYDPTTKQTTLTFSGNGNIPPKGTKNHKPFGNGNPVPHFGFTGIVPGATKGGEKIPPVTREWTRPHGLPPVLVPAAGATFHTGTTGPLKYLIVFVKAGDPNQPGDEKEADPQVGNWYEFPMQGGYQASFTAADDEISLKDAKFFISPTQIPLDHLNEKFLPPSDPRFQPLPGIPNGTVLPPDGSTPIINTGTIKAPSGTVVPVTGTMILAEGTLLADGVGTLALSGADIITPPGGTLESQGGGVIEVTASSTLDGSNTIYGAEGPVILQHADILVDDGQTLFLQGLVGDFGATITAAGSGAVDSSGLLIGHGSIAAPVTNTGYLDAYGFGQPGGVLTLAGPVGGSGNLRIEPGSTLVLDSAASAASTQFNGTSADLQLADPLQLTTTITGFTLGDTIDLANVTFSASAITLDYVQGSGSGELTVLDSGGTVATLDLLGTYDTTATNTFTLQADANGGTAIVLDPPAAGADTVAAGAGGGMAVGSNRSPGFQAGSDPQTIHVGAGNETIDATGNELFVFANGQAGGNDVIANFGSSDFLHLQGYGAGAAAAALATTTHVAGGTMISLPDGTRIMLAGVSHLHAGPFH